VGFVPVRCRDCEERFTQSLWQFGNWQYARCPRCYRLDLSIWSESHYIVSWDMRLLMTLGAKKFRCEVCRHNFVSFRRLKERFSFHRDRKDGPAADRQADVEDAEGRGRLEGMGGTEPPPLEEARKPLAS
jgi:hypothetical protein